MWSSFSGPGPRTRTSRDVAWSSRRHTLLRPKIRKWTTRANYYFRSVYIEHWVAFDRWQIRNVTARVQLYSGTRNVAASHKWHQILGWDALREELSLFSMCVVGLMRLNGKNVCLQSVERTARRLPRSSQACSTPPGFPGRDLLSSSEENSSVESTNVYCTVPKTLRTTCCLLWNDWYSSTFCPLGGTAGSWTARIGGLRCQDARRWTDAWHSVRVSNTALPIPINFSGVCRPTSVEQYSRAIPVVFVFGWWCPQVMILQRALWRIVVLFWLSRILASPYLSIFVK